MKLSMFIIMKSRTSSNLGHGRSKSKSQAQVIEKPLFHIRPHIFGPICMKFGLNVSLNNDLEEYKIWVTCQNGVFGSNHANTHFMPS